MIQHVGIYLADIVYRLLYTDPHPEDINYKNTKILAR